MSTSPPPHLSESSNSEGAFHTSALLPGNYELRAGENSLSVKAHSGDADIVLRVGSMQTVRGTVHDSTTLSMPRVTVLPKKSMFPARPFVAPLVSNGAFDVLLDPGSYALIAWYTNDHIAIQEIEVSPFEEPAPVELRPTPSGSLILQNDAESLAEWELRFEGFLLLAGSLAALARETIAAPEGLVELMYSRVGTREKITEEFRVVAAHTKPVFLFSSER